LKVRYNYENENETQEEREIRKKKIGMKRVRDDNDNLFSSQISYSISSPKNSSVQNPPVSFSLNQSTSPNFHGLSQDGVKKKKNKKKGISNTFLNSSFNKKSKMYNIFSPLLIEDLNISEKKVQYIVLLSHNVCFETVDEHIGIDYFGEKKEILGIKKNLSNKDLVDEIVQSHQTTEPNSPLNALSEESPSVIESSKNKYDDTSDDVNSLTSDSFKENEKDSNHIENEDEKNETPDMQIDDNNELKEKSPDYSNVSAYNSPIHHFLKPHLFFSKEISISKCGSFALEYYQNKRNNELQKERIKKRKEKREKLKEKKREFRLRQQGLLGESSTQTNPLFPMTDLKLPPVLSQVSHSNPFLKSSPNNKSSCLHSSDLIITECNYFFNKKIKVSVIGDIHGQFADLCTILKTTGFPVDKEKCINSDAIPHTIVFMGDYVDRGQSSAEVLIILMALKVAHPKSVFLIRGNHEATELNLQFGFTHEIARKYHVLVYLAFSRLFCALPLCALIRNKVFCVHGGIPIKEKMLERKYKERKDWIKKYSDIGKIGNFPKFENTFFESEESDKIL
jgi:predicted MPP superfamily phosphohydrolase